MGKIVEKKKKMKKKKKKKGRPSLLDLQKHNLKQHREQTQRYKWDNSARSLSRGHDPAVPRRSTQRNPIPDASFPGKTDNDGEFSGKRREKKLKLILKLPAVGQEGRRLVQVRRGRWSRARRRRRMVRGWVLCDGVDWVEFLVEKNRTKFLVWRGSIGWWVFVWRGSIWWCLSLEARIAAGLSKWWNPVPTTSCLDGDDPGGKSTGPLELAAVRSGYGGRAVEESIMWSKKWSKKQSLVAEAEAWRSWRGIWEEARREFMV